MTICLFCNKKNNCDTVLICQTCLKRESKRVATQNKRSKKHNAGSLSIHDWLTVLAKSNFNCNHCTHHFSFLTLDHITSMCIGGKNNKDNIQALCSKCHELKSKIETKKTGNKKKRIEAKELETSYYDIL